MCEHELPHTEKRAPRIGQRIAHKLKEGKSEAIAVNGEVSESE